MVAYRKVLRLGLVGAVLAAVLPWAASDAAGPTTHEGYLTLRDGVQLHYVEYLPSDHGRFPTLFTYDQYSAGSTNTSSTYTANGYAVVGVNLRGSGCSTGVNNFTNAAVWGRDGAEVVEWIARQQWSDGHVGMFGASFPGLAQLGVAAFAPPHLDAIAPEQNTVDYYRDIAYPGGIYNESWMTEYSAFIYNNQANAYEDGVKNADTSCGALTPTTRLGDLSADNAAQAPQHPYVDNYWRAAPLDRLSAIKVPVFACQEWQDGAVGSRSTSIYFGHPLDPARTWFAGDNGPHGACSAIEDPLLLKFFDRYVKGVHNGWESTPHVILGHEMSGGEGIFGTGATPAWVSHIASWPSSPRTTTFYLHAGGSVDLTRPREVGSSSYSYPLPSSSLGVEEFSGYENVPTWQGYDAPGGHLVFTTPALRTDAEFFGSGSLNLWMSSTASDTDLQVTLSEIRPDGMEQYLQRGWLRASHRALDTTRSSATRPYHLDTEVAAQPLVPGQPVLARVELMPFDHVFRAGSSLRLTIDAPTGTTFGDQFRFLTTPAVNTVYTSPGMPSSLVLALVPGGKAMAPESSCGLIMNEPCRPDMGTTPGGLLTLP